MNTQKLQLTEEITSNSLILDDLPILTPGIISHTTFIEQFNEQLKKIMIDINGTMTIIFDYKYNKSLNGTTFPNDLESIIFGYAFNQFLNNVNFPNSLKSIKFGSAFNKSLDNVQFPESLESITFGQSFNQQFDNLPNTIKCITIFSVKNKLTNLPVSIDKIKFRRFVINIMSKIKIPYGCIIVDNNDEIVNILQ